MKNKFNQLDLLRQLDAPHTRETMFLDQAMGKVGNFAYLRTLIKFSDFNEQSKCQITEALTDSMENLAQLCYKLSRYNRKYKKKELSDFLAPTVPKSGLYVMHPPQVEELVEIFTNNEAKLSGMMLAFKDITTGFEPTVDRILKNFRLSTINVLNGEVD